MLSCADWKLQSVSLLPPVVLPAASTFSGSPSTVSGPVQCWAAQPAGPPATVLFLCHFPSAFLPEESFKYSNLMWGSPLPRLSVCLMPAGSNVSSLQSVVRPGPADLSDLVTPSRAPRSCHLGYHVPSLQPAEDHLTSKTSMPGTFQH